MLEFLSLSPVTENAKPRPVRAALVAVPLMAFEDPSGLLWSLKARRSTAKCVIHAEASGTELVILQDEEVAFREAFPDESTARLRADALHDRLMQKGWTEAV